ncbi:glycoside hydrolase family 79 protein [Gymnopilus junonius]|uniref:Glycoside hydrolase family 79 protein n=1 Tax=Gymnopilus junonius TaxID=109634 RepID=A0A9P5NUW0_GYMJU|nr:glycoside hydrolase family 79 protein [Gymnopilus junonius]
MIPLALLYALSVKLALVLALSSLKLQGPPTLPSDASHLLNPALASFSIETAFFEEFFGNASAPNRLSLSLLENLKARTGVPAEIRIGGITADSTYWNASQSAALSNFIDSAGALHNTTIGPQFWKSVGLLPHGTKITMTLDLHDLNYEDALLMAKATFEGLVPGQLFAFEIGNEPDQYQVPFTPQSYTAVWATWAKNISTALGIKSPEFQLGATVIDPIWPYDTPGASSALDCVSALAAGADNGHVAKTCSEHTYQYSVCDPARTAVATLPNLVNHTRLAEYLDLWQPRIGAVRQQLGDDAFVIGEYNSVSCSGKDGVSNTFGQALWLLDTILYATSINVSRLYMHQGGPLALQSSTQLNHGGLSFYDMWHPVQNQNGPIQVFPSYSTYLFVGEVLGHSTSLKIANLYPGRQANGSSITTALGDQSAGQLVAYGFWDTSQPSSHSFPTKFALLNLQIFNQTQSGPRPKVEFDISAFRRDQHRPIKIRRLQAPGADVKLSNLTTWAGQSYFSGVATGDLKEEKQQSSIIAVQASEAALVFL